MKAEYKAYCHECGGKPVDKLEIGENQRESTIRMRVHCHGEICTCEISRLILIQALKIGEIPGDRFTVKVIVKPMSTGISLKPLRNIGGVIMPDCWENYF